MFNTMFAFAGVTIFLLLLLASNQHAVFGFHPSSQSNRHYNNRGKHRILGRWRTNTDTAGAKANDYVVGMMIAPQQSPSAAATATIASRGRYVAHPSSSSSSALRLASSTTTTNSETTSTNAPRLTTVPELQASVDQLKKVLEREYLSFFNPMEREYYADSVTFDDPLNDLAGVDGYQANVDMLAGRTLLGSLLFRDAGIALHSVTGGHVTQSDDANTMEISEITTRWTLRFTFKILPWSPTPRFSGISRYTVRLGGPKGIQIVRQADFWDTINLKPGGADYEACDRAVAVQHFVDLIKPGNFEAPPAGPELPYVTLRIGKGGYEVRRYPSYSAVQMKYERRDEAFTELGAFTSGMKPLSPAIISVGQDDKFMLWPLDYALPGQKTPPMNEKALSRAEADPTFEIVTIPEQVVATQRFTGSIVAPLVRQVDSDLRKSLVRDGLQAATEAGSVLKFAQYDAVYSMGQRRSEVHIPLQDGGHPW